MISFTRTCRASCAWLGLLPLVSGCSESYDGPELVQISGTVTLDGEPLSGAVLSFTPTGSTRGFGAGGYTDAVGRYELFTRGDIRGAAAGEYRVVAKKWMMPDGSDFLIASGSDPSSSAARQILPARYSEREKTELSATIRAGSGTIDFPLSSQK